MTMDGWCTLYTTCQKSKVYLSAWPWSFNRSWPYSTLQFEFVSLDYLVRQRSTYLGRRTDSTKVGRYLCGVSCTLDKTWLAASQVMYSDDQIIRSYSVEREPKVMRCNSLLVLRRVLPKHRMSLLSWSDYTSFAIVFDWSYLIRRIEIYLLSYLIRLFLISFLSD